MRGHPITIADIAQAPEGASRIIEDAGETTPDPRLAAAKAAIVRKVSETGRTQSEIVDELLLSL